MGIYRPIVRDKDGTEREIQIWWLDYYSRGQRIRESSKSTKKGVAEAVLKQRLGEVAQGKTPGVYLDRVTFSELAAGYQCEYPEPKDKAGSFYEKHLASHRRVKEYIGHLSDFFKGYRANEIDTAHLWKYREKRRSEEAADSTINRELAGLRRMFNLARKCNPPKVDHVPHFPMVQENNVRKGFFEHGDFLALREALPEYLKGFVSFAYRSGWRSGEIRNLKWTAIDWTAGTVTLNKGETKSGAGRVLYLDAELREVLEQQHKRWRNSGQLIPYVFTERRGRGRMGDFRKAWEKALGKAGLAGMLFHDLRRTAVRNMVRAGIPERVAMQISGHKTRSVFDRYNIVSDADLRAAAETHAAYLADRSNIRSKIAFPGNEPKKAQGRKPNNQPSLQNAPVAQPG